MEYLITYQTDKPAPRPFVHLEPRPKRYLSWRVIVKARTPEEAIQRFMAKRDRKSRRASGRITHIKAEDQS